MALTAGTVAYSSGEATTERTPYTTRSAMGGICRKRRKRKMAKKPRYQEISAAGVPVREENGRTIGIFGKLARLFNQQKNR